LARWSALARGVTVGARPTELQFEQPGHQGARPCGGGGSDFNGDSHLDVATTNVGVPNFLTGDGTDVLLGDGNGNFPR
jgi:hypothetical protein